MPKWQEIKFGRLVDFHNRHRVPLSKIVRAGRQGPYPYYGAQGVIDHIDDYLFDGPYLLVAEDGENLRSRKTPIARIVEGRFWVNNHAHVLRARECADIRFLNYLLNQVSLSGQITGAAQPKLTKRNLAELMVRCPPLESQRRVASVLAAFSQLIAINQRRIDILENIALALYREWFVHFRFPGHHDVRFINSKLGRIPQGWNIKKIGGTVATMHRSPVTPTDSPDAYFEYFSIPAFDAGQLSVSEKGVEIKSLKYAVDQPSVLLAKLNPRIGRVWRVTPKSNHAITSTEFLVWTGVEVSNAWLWCLFTSDAFRGMVSGRASGTSTSHQRFNASDVEGYEVAVAPPAVLTAFDVVAESVLNSAEKFREVNSALTNAREILVPHLIDGSRDIGEIELGILS